MVQHRLPMLVAEAWDDGEDFVQAVMLDDHRKPGFTIIEFEDAVQIGKARVRVDDRSQGDMTAPLGQLYVRNGNAAISYLTWGHIVLLQVPLADADGIPDGDYGFNWSLECSVDGQNWGKVYEAHQKRSWLNDWRPADEDIAHLLPSALEALPHGLIPPE
jgi:hypothetical protein